MVEYWDNGSRWGRGSSCSSSSHGLEDTPARESHKICLHIRYETKYFLHIKIVINITILFFSIAPDTHNTVAEEFFIPPGDVLLHTGDFTDMGLPEDVDQFVTFITSQPHPHKVGTMSAMNASSKV